MCIRDSIVICTIYGMCRVHFQSLKSEGRFQTEMGNLFKYITEAYSEINKKDTVNVGKRFFTFHTTVSWVLVEVYID